jgi:hypothetical protein
MSVAAPGSSWRAIARNTSISGGASARSSPLANIDGPTTTGLITKPTLESRTGSAAHRATDLSGAATNTTVGQRWRERYSTAYTGHA